MVFKADDFNNARNERRNQLGNDENNWRTCQGSSLDAYAPLDDYHRPRGRDCHLHHFVDYIPRPAVVLVYCADLPLVLSQATGLTPSTGQIVCTLTTFLICCAVCAVGAFVYFACLKSVKDGIGGVGATLNTTSDRKFPFLVENISTLFKYSGK